MLAGELDSIIHSGASVNLVRSYQSLKAVNVLGTQVNMAGLAAAEFRKDILSFRTSSCEGCSTDSAAAPCRPRCVWMHRPKYEPRALTAPHESVRPAGCKSVDYRPCQRASLILQLFLSAPSFSGILSVFFRVELSIY